MPKRLVLSVFPGIDILGRGFEEVGFCVVRGPGVLWGGDIRTFHPPARVFEGVIGGPPCQLFSVLKNISPTAGEMFGNLIPEFERVVAEAAPKWWLMENVVRAPDPAVDGYEVHRFDLDNRWLGEAQRRRRRIWFGSRDGRRLDVQVALFESALAEAHPVLADAQPRPVARCAGGKMKRPAPPAAVLGGHTKPGRGKGTAPETARSLAEMCVLQGVAPDLLDDAPFTVHGKRAAIGNAVSLFMARSLAEAVEATIRPRRRRRDNSLSQRGG